MGKNCTYFFWFFFMTAAFAFSAEEEITQETTKKLPFGADIYLSNNLGASTAFKAYQQDPYAASSLFLYPYYKTAPFLGEREFRLQTELSTAFEWMGKENPFPGKLTDKFSLGDLKVRAELKKALWAKDLGLSLSPALKLEAPVSKAARDSNRVIGLGGYLNANWSKWGFSLTYKPVAMGYAYREKFKSGACTEGSGNDDRLSGGDCKVAGRQTMALVKNSVVAGYTVGNHNVTLGFRSYHSFLRKAQSGEKPEEKPSSGIMEATLGWLEYSYSIASTLPTTLTLGLSGYQNPYDAREGFRTPFFSFADPKANLTEAYFAVNVSI
jgi:hypothetical protein